MTTMTTDPRASALDVISEAVQAKLSGDECIPMAVIIAQGYGLTGDEIREAFKREGLDFADVLPLVQGYVEKEDAL